MSLDEVLKSSLETIPECIFSACIDIESGLMLGAQAGDEVSPDEVEHLAAAMGCLFNGSDVRSVEALFSAATPKSGDTTSYFQEMIIYGNDLLHVFLRAKQNENLVVCYVCSDAVNPGLVLIRSRMTLAGIVATI